MATFSTATQTTADLEANANLVKALSGYASANRALINTAVSEQARTFRTLQKIIGDFNNANNTGSASGYMRAAVDLATAPLKNEPVDQRLANDVSTFLDAHPGRFASDPDMAKAIWQDAARKHLPDSVQAWGNVDYLRKQTGLEGKSDEEILAVVTDGSTDPRAADALRMMLDQARRQQQVIDMSKNLQADLKPSVDVLLGRYGSVDNIPQAELEKWKREHQPELLRARTAFGMADIKALADAEANKEVVLTGTAKEAYDFNVEMQKRLTAQTTTESDRDRAAKIINGAVFREWAQSNGFSIGRVEQPDPNTEYAPGELTTAGLYIPGRDDYKAVMLFQRQLGMDPNKAHPFMPQGAGTRGNLQEYGSINVQLAPPGATPAPAAAPEPPPAEEFTDAAGWKYRLYNGEVSVIGGPPGTETEATPANPLKLPPETARKALSEWLSDGTGTDVSADVEAALNDSKAAAPSEAAPGKAPETETVYGAFNKKFGADPIGSQRVSGKLYLKDASTGNFYLAPDQSARAEGTTLTAGGGPNALKAFAEEVRARREANIARRGLSKEDGAKAPLRTAAIGLAQTLTPERQTEAEKARAVEYNRQQEMERRAQEQVATEAPTTPQEALLRAQNKWNTTNADQGYLGREDESATANVPITSIPSVSYAPNATVPNALAGTGTGIGSTRVAATPQTDMRTEREIVQAEKDRVAARTANISIKPQPSVPLSEERAKAQEANVRAWLAENPAGAPIKAQPPKERPSPPLSPERAKAQEANVRRDLAASANTAPPKPESQRQALLEQKPQYRDLLTVPTAKSTNTPSPATTQYAR